MRQTITISIPPALKNEIDTMVSTGMYASTSELMRDAIRQLKRKALVRNIEMSKKEFAQGKGKILRNLGDLRS